MRSRFQRIASLFLALLCGVALRSYARERPIRIGCSMPLSGPLGGGGGGKSALMAMQMWVDDVNAKGGLLGRRVQLICRDDHTNPVDVQPIYEDLLNKEKVDFIVGPFGVPSVSQAIPFAMKHRMVLPVLFAVDANRALAYRYYFSILPAGPDPYLGLSEGFFEAASAQNPRPTTLVILANNNEYGQNAACGAMQNARAYGFTLLDVKQYPQDTKDFAPILEAIKKEDPDVLYVDSYPADTKAILRTAKAIGLKPKVFGGGMVGLQYTQMQAELGPLLNGIVTMIFWTPEFGARFPQGEQFIKRYQARAKQAGIDPLGYYLPPYAYAYMQLLEVAITSTGSLDQAKVGDYLRTHPIDTIVGKISFGPNGEWDHSRILQIQFQGIQGHDPEEFARKGAMAIVAPGEYKTRALMYPFPGWD